MLINKQIISNFLCEFTAENGFCVAHCRCFLVGRHCRFIGKHLNNNIVVFCAIANTQHECTRVFVALATNYEVTQRIKCKYWFCKITANKRKSPSGVLYMCRLVRVMCARTKCIRRQCKEKCLVSGALWTRFKSLHRHTMHRTATGKHRRPCIHQHEKCCLLSGTHSALFSCRHSYTLLPTPRK